MYPHRQKSEKRVVGAVIQQSGLGRGDFGINACRDIT